MEREIWKDIKGYEGLYQVSNLGRIKSLESTVFSGNRFNKKKTKRNKKEKILKLRFDKDGYYRIGLCKNNKKIYYFVHRLVAQTFISNPNNLPVVNHKNENKKDNRVENLEWCTIKYNNNYGNRILKLKTKGKRVIQKTLDDIKINEYINARQASEFTNTCRTSIINCCNKKVHFITAGGYKWEYAKEE